MRKICDRGLYQREKLRGPCVSLLLVLIGLCAPFTILGLSPTVSEPVCSKSDCEVLSDGACVTRCSKGERCDAQGNCQREGTQEGERLLLVEGLTRGRQVWIGGLSLGKDELSMVGEVYRFTGAFSKSRSRGEIEFYPNPAHDGFGTFVVVERNDGSRVLVRRHISGRNDPLSLPLPVERPAALHLVGESLFVGSTGEVGRMDLGSEDVSYERIMHREEMANKPYDIFARHGNRLLAIDNMVLPIIADYFALDETGNATHLVGGEIRVFLPRVSYRSAILTAGSDGRKILYAIVTYGGRTPGQALLSIRVSDSVLTSGLVSIEEVSEQIYFEPRRPAKLMVGDKFTPLTGLAFYRPERGGRGSLLVAAGERGLIVLPERLASNPRPRLVRLNGPCLDVAVIDGKVYALLGGESPGVVRLRLKNGQWSADASILPLDEAPVRFVP